MATTKRKRAKKKPAKPVNLEDLSEGEKLDAILERIAELEARMDERFDQTDALVVTYSA